MRYAVIVMVNADDDPQAVLNQIISALEFEHTSTVKAAVVLNDDGEELAVYDRKEEKQ
jgi:hypothetical protein